jgi:hypothetical protein
MVQSSDFSALKMVCLERCFHIVASVAFPAPFYAMLGNVEVSEEVLVPSRGGQLGFRRPLGNRLPVHLKPPHLNSAPQLHTCPFLRLHKDSDFTPWVTVLPGAVVDRLSWAGPSQGLRSWYQDWRQHKAPKPRWSCI